MLDKKGTRFIDFVLFILETSQLKEKQGVGKENN